ncbi:hypothetical protein K0504_12415 [Neiella marina]|uniref:Uncharacterized protein n=1 Tax=Neiella holothuriorum TaxID=2870530 RepID=A0ABS7EHM2_9GAMM|nr:hypothetical protein [Neiella holothuriorum]MBW8191841.1 hypothetical protein [Neiella holothuriorum]
MLYRQRMANLFKVLLVVLLAGCSEAPDTNKASEGGAGVAPKIKLIQRTQDEVLGTVFTPVDLNREVLVEKISFSQLQLDAEMDAIWGATGRDDAGNIYFGVSSHGGQQGTSELFKYNPYSGQFKSLGDTVSQLTKLGLAPSDVKQNKLHSKIIAADDGYLYFSSFDESGESQRNLTLPTWGGHLWRTRPGSAQWEHLLATEHALIAVQVRDRYVYALGYWGHELFQFNMVSGEVKTVSVGSDTAHVSRNFLIDQHANVYIPKVRETGDGLSYASLEHYDRKLNHVTSYIMPNYVSKSWDGYHGITGYAETQNGDVYFVTQEGRLYRLDSTTGGLDKLKELGFMHPKGNASIESLFSLDGNQYLGAVARAKGQKKAQWLTYDLNLKQATATTLPSIPSNRLIYGSVTRDNEGHIYLVGSHWQGRKGKPTAWKISI